MAFLGIYLSFNINDCGYFMSILCLLILSNDNVYRLILGFCLLVCFFFYSLILLMYSYIFKKHKKLCIWRKKRGVVYTRTARVSMSSYLKSKCHIYALVYDFFFSFWLTSLCIIHSWFIHLIELGKERVGWIEWGALKYIPYYM